MFPDLLSIGPLTIHTYGLLVAVGFFASLLVTVRTGISDGMSPQLVMDMGFVIVLSAMAGSRVMYVLMNVSYFSHHPVDIFKVWHGGLVFSGGIIAAVPTLAWYANRHHLSSLKVADLWAPGAAIGQGIGRIGCFMAGCCYGKPTDLEWGVTFTHPHSLAPLNISLHPTQLYSSISGFIIFLILLLLYPNRKYEGQIFIWFLILHSTARLLIERFRGDDRGAFLSSSVSVTQFVTTLILIASVVALIILKSKGTKRPHIP